MNREDRAKQFAPFEALRGLGEELHRIELKHEKQNKKDLSDDKVKEISTKLSSLKKGMTIKILCFENGYYIWVQDKITKIDIINQSITIGEGVVLFENIFDIVICE